MYNQITDQLRLVEVEVFRRITLFGRPLPKIKNVSQEVFRREIPLGSVRAGAETGGTQRRSRLRVRTGDTIYRVSLIPQPYTVVGTLATEDNYRCIYELLIEVAVTNPALFIQEYRRRSDPVAQVIRVLKKWFAQLVAGLEHDKVFSLKLPLDRWNNAFEQHIGVRITQKYMLSIKDDPKRIGLYTIEQDKNLKIASLRANADIQQVEDEIDSERESRKNRYKRSEEEKQKAFERDEKTKEHIHILRKKFRDAAGNEMVAILQERIRESFERGKPISEISEDYFMLLDTFQEALHLDVEENLLSEREKESFIEGSDGLNTYIDNATSGLENDVIHRVTNGSLSNTQSHITHGTEVQMENIYKDDPPESDSIL